MTKIAKEGKKERKMTVKINNFDLEWQMRRLEVKKIKDVATKATLVKDYALRCSDVKEGDVFYEKARVMRALNWARTTRLAYQKRNADATAILTDLIDRLSFVVKLGKFKDDEAMDAKLEIGKIDVKDLKGLVSDLERRKYNLKFKGVKPKNHVEFVKVITSEIAKRTAETPAVPEQAGGKKHEALVG